MEMRAISYHALSKVNCAMPIIVMLTLMTVNVTTVVILTRDVSQSRNEFLKMKQSDMIRKLDSRISTSSQQNSVNMAGKTSGALHTGRL